MRNPLLLMTISGPGFRPHLLNGENRPALTMFRYNSKDTFQTLYVYLSEYQSGKRISHKKVLELSYEDVKSAKNGLIVITPDFDNFTAKLIAADEYSKYMTEMPSWRVLQTENIMADLQRL